MATLDQSALRRIEMRISQEIDNMLRGDFQGAIPGSGSETGDSRQYEPGDDVRRMDWSATARTGVPHVRDLVVDQQLSIVVIVDRSASMEFGTASVGKPDVALGVTAAFALIAERGGTRFGSVLAGTGDPVVVRPQARRPASEALLRKLTRPEPTPGPARLGDAIGAAATASTRRGLIVVVSDLLGSDDWVPAVRRAAATNDVIVAEVVDPREDELVAVGEVTFVDPETGRWARVDTDSVTVRDRFAAAAQARRAEHAAAARQAGAAHVLLRCDEDWAEALVRFLLLRRQAARAGRRR